MQILACVRRTEIRKEVLLHRAHSYARNGQKSSWSMKCWIVCRSMTWCISANEGGWLGLHRPIVACGRLPSQHLAGVLSFGQLRPMSAIVVVFHIHRLYFQKQSQLCHCPSPPRQEVFRFLPVDGPGLAVRLVFGPFRLYAELSSTWYESQLFLRVVVTGKERDRYQGQDEPEVHIFRVILRAQVSCSSTNT